MAGYGTDQGLTDYLTALGLTLPSDASAAAVLIFAVLTHGCRNVRIWNE